VGSPDEKKTAQNGLLVGTGRLLLMRQEWTEKKKRVMKGKGLELTGEGVGLGA
jgi:hypothetical protein